MRSEPSPRAVELTAMSTVYPQEFESLYALWPKKAEKYAAYQEWKRQLKKGGVPTLIAEMEIALHWQAPIYQRSREGVQFMPSFRRWLHNRGWEEEAVDGIKKGGSNGNGRHAPDVNAAHGYDPKGDSQLQAGYARLRKERLA